MAGLSPAHLILILVIALVVIGPGKLPEVGGAIGKSLREFQKATGQAQDAQPPQPAQPQPMPQQWQSPQPWQQPAQQWQGPQPQPWQQPPPQSWPQQWPSQPMPSAAA